MFPTRFGVVFATSICFDLILQIVFACVPGEQKHRISSVFEPLVDDMKMLWDTGVVIGDIRFKAVIGLLCADQPGKCTLIS
jgi:hypothetical protein